MRLFLSRLEYAVHASIFRNAPNGTKKRSENARWICRTLTTVLYVVLQKLRQQLEQDASSGACCARVRRRGGKKITRKFHAP